MDRLELELEEKEGMLSKTKEKDIKDEVEEKEEFIKNDKKEKERKKKKKDKAGVWIFGDDYKYGENL